MPWREPVRLLQAVVAILGLILVTVGCGSGDALTSPKGKLDTTATLDTTGSLQVSSVTSGTSPDPDGYSVSLDGADHGVLGIAAAITVTGLAPGRHMVGLGGVADNCQVQGDNVRAVTVLPRASATEVFSITCVEPSTSPPPPPPPPPPGARPGIPFGFFRMDFSKLSSDWTSLKRIAIPETILPNLDFARRQGSRVFLQLTQGHRRYQNPDLTFNLDKFKQLLDEVKHLELESYIADGTIAGHLMIDEPSDPHNWGGGPIPYQMIEEAAKYSKELWPNLPTLVRSKPSWLASAPFRWKYLDAGWAQYAARFGDVIRYRDGEIRGATAAGLRVVWGLNVTDGGDGSSRIPGHKLNKFSMSPDELLRYGKPLLDASSTCGFLMWMYDSEYLANDDVLAALKTLSQEAKDQPSRSCGNHEE